MERWTEEHARTAAQQPSRVGASARCQTILKKVVDNAGDCAISAHEQQGQQHEDAQDWHRG